MRCGLLLALGDLERAMYAFVPGRLLLAVAAGGIAKTFRLRLLNHSGSFRVKVMAKADRQERCAASLGS